MVSISNKNNTINQLQSVWLDRHFCVVCYFLHIIFLSLLLILFLFHYIYICTRYNNSEMTTLVNRVFSLNHPIIYFIQQIENFSWYAYSKKNSPSLSYLCFLFFFFFSATRTNLSLEMIFISP